MRSLDAFLPSFEFVERHAVAVDADPARIDDALRRVTFGEVPAVCALLALRGTRGVPRDVSVLDAMRRRGTLLEDVPGEGIVLSLRGQFWRWRGGRSEDSDADAFAVLDWRIEDGRLSTETRVHVPDARSRRKFARYWRLIRPFSGLTRMLVLRAAKRRAEAAA